MASSVWVEPQYVTPIRFIAEYYTFEYLTLEERLDEAGQRFDLKPLGSLGRLFAGPFGSTLPTSVFVDEGIPLLRVQNVGELEILTDNLANIGWDTHRKIIRSKLVSGDLAIAKAGRIGTTAIIPSSIPECNVTQHVVGVQVSKNRVDNYYLAAFLVSKYGQFQFERQGVGTLLKYLGVEDTRQAKVALPPRPVQEYIGAKVRLAEHCRARAREIFNQGNQLLYDYLELSPVQESKALSWRIDPVQHEFEGLTPKNYRPKFLAVESELRRRGAHLLDDLIRTSDGISNGATPRGADYVEYGIAFLRVQNIAKNFVDLSNVVYVTPRMDEKLGRSRIKPYDVILTITGYPGNAAVATPDLLPLNINQHSVRLGLRSGINPFYVAAFLNSEYGYAQVQQKATGATRDALNYGAVRSLRVPVIPKEQQDEVGKHFEVYGKLLRCAQQLVHEAKADVEALIEGRLDVEAIVAGQVQPLTWEDVEV
jgi:type I restriction enzyme S subunit